MKVQRHVRVLASILVLATLLTACAPAATQSPTQAPAATAEPGAKALRVALILPGRADDVSWNQAAYEGMQRAIKAAKAPVELKVVEEVYDPVDIEPALRDYAQQGYDLIVGHGFQFQEPIIKVAAEFPNVNFAIGSGFKLAPNVGIYDVKLEQGGYIMGIIAASLSEANIVGVVGGQDVSEIHRGHVGFLKGAQSTKPDIKVLNNFVGDFNDLAGAKEAALSEMRAGADVLWQSGDGVGLAVLGACKEQNVLGMGNVVDQQSIAPDNTVASFVYDWGAAYTQMVNETADKQFGNKKYWIEFANQGVSIVFNETLKSKLSDDALAAIDEAEKGFADGSLDLGDLDSVKLEQLAQ